MSREATFDLRRAGRVDDAGKVTLEPSRVLAALAGFTFPVEVFTCTWVVTDLGEGDLCVWLCSADDCHHGSIPPIGFARRGRDWSSAGERTKGRLIGDAPDVTQLGAAVIAETPTMSLRECREAFTIASICRSITFADDWSSSTRASVSSRISERTPVSSSTRRRAACNRLVLVKENHSPVTGAELVSMACARLRWRVASRSSVSRWSTRAFRS
jgi:hypothetical protein